VDFLDFGDIGADFLHNRSLFQIAGKIKGARTAPPRDTLSKTGSAEFPLWRLQIAGKLNDTQMP